MGGFKKIYHIATESHKISFLVIFNNIFGMVEVFLDEFYNISWSPLSPIFIQFDLLNPLIYVTDKFSFMWK